MKSLKSVLPRSLSRHLTLLRTFAVCSALIITLIGGLLATDLQRVAQNIALQQETSVAVGQAETLLHGGVLLDGNSTRLSRGAVRYLTYYARQSVAYGLYVLVKVWGRDGTILFSNETALINHRLPMDDELIDVLSGRRSSVAGVSNLSARENRGERRFHHLLEVYVPIHSGRHIVGAYELYQSLAGLDAAEAALDRAIGLGVAVGFLALYLSLFLIVRNASRRLLRQSRALEHQALHDALTGLPNRALLHNRVRRTLGQAHTTGRGGSAGAAALLLMDLDRFKEVNDTFGHHHGDLLLQEVGQRLRAALGAAATVARLGGDEFAILLPEAGFAGAIQAAGEMLRVVERPFELEGYSVASSASIGIALAPQHGDEAVTLLRRADVAMYAAKRAVSGYSVYDPAQDQYSPARLALLGELRQAIEQDQLVLHFQPKVNVYTGDLDGVEALVRWQHPQRGLLGPHEFIPLVEQTGLLAPLTRWVVAAALRQCRAWQDAGLTLRVAVNLSARLLHDARLADMVADLLQAQDVPPHLLDIEITESAVMHDPSHAVETLTRLHHMGLRLAIDDFGTGHSSLAYLQRLPVAEIKIDKSFVLEMFKNAGDGAIVRSIIDLGHMLGLKVVAEGVETRECWERLRAMSCDVAQGYYLSRPIPAADLAQWARRLPREARKAG